MEPPLRKPTLSPSKITTYLACPVKYRWTYVDDRGKWYLRSRSYYSFGTSLHTVLQRFHDSSDAGVETTEQALVALEENWIESGYSSQEEMMQALSEGKAIVENYIESVSTLPTTAQTLFVERQLRSDLGLFDLIGRLDRVDEREDKSLEIVDYKSGRDSLSVGDVATDLAMGCYQILLRDLFPGRTVVATIIALRTNAKATYGFSDEEAKQFRDDLEFLGKEILFRDYENLTPVPKRLCLSCDFLPLCKRHPDFEAPVTTEE